jgi:hypothetical protein
MDLVDVLAAHEVADLVDAERVDLRDAFWQNLAPLLGWKRED